MKSQVGFQKWLVAAIAGLALGAVACGGEAEPTIADDVAAYEQAVQASTASAPGGGGVPASEPSGAQALFLVLVGSASSSPDPMPGVITRSLPAGTTESSSPDPVPARPASKTSSTGAAPKACSEAKDAGTDQPVAVR